MPTQCMACSSFAKFWVKDGSHNKPACTWHSIKYGKLGYKTWPMTKQERE